MKAIDTRSLKRKEAEERNAKWTALSLEDQLAYLNKMFGKGKGAGKQRVKIAKQIKIRDAKAKPAKSEKDKSKGKRRQDARKAKA